MEPVKAFTIDRAKWLHGEGESSSFLLRASDSKQCCLGFYLESCGIPRDKLENRASPGNIAFLGGVQLPEWLLDIGTLLHSDEASALMVENDSVVTSDFHRESAIIAGFARVGIVVTFTGEY
jgi:hypothetical protein